MFIDFPVPRRDVTDQIFPGQGELVSDTPPGDGKIDSLFFPLLKG